VVGDLKDFKFILLRPFNINEIKEYLDSNFESSEKTDSINTVIERVFTNKGISILSIPRYLEIQKETIELNQLGVEQILNMPRIDFFESFIFKKLEIDYKGKSKGNEIIISKRVLEKIALIMEIYQCNSISRDELITILDNIDSNLVNIFLNQVEIDNFISRVLKFPSDLIEFDNTEFQEYLAAKELLRIGKKRQIIYDLILEKNTMRIFKNWFDVLYYVVEIEPEHFLTILDFLKQKMGFQIDDDFLIFLKVINPEKLNSRMICKIFETVYQYIQDSGRYIYYEHADFLAKFFSDENNELLILDEKISDLNHERINTNKLRLINSLVKFGSLTISDDLAQKDVIIKYAINEEFEHLNDVVFSVLSNFKNIEVLKVLETKLDSKNHTLRKKFIKCCYRVDSNDEFVIEKILKGIESNIEGAMKGFFRITDIEKIKRILSSIVSNERLLDVFIDFHRYFSSYHKQEFILNISKHFDKELENSLLDLIKAFLLKIYSYKENDSLQLFIEVLLKSKKASIIKIIKLAENGLQLRAISFHIAPFIESSNVKSVLDAISSTSFKYAVDDFYFYLRSSRNINKNIVLEKIQKYVPETVTHYETTAENKRNESNNQVYERFKSELYLDGKEEKYITNVFKTYYDNEKILNKLILNKDSDRLKNIILNIYKYSNPKTFSIKINSRKSGSINYTVSNIHVNDFAYCILVGEVLGLKEQLKEYRKKIIGFIPFVSNYSIKVSPNTYNSKDEIDIILDFLGDIKPDELDPVIKNLKQRKDDLIEFRANQIVKTASKIKHTGFIPILRGLVNDSSIDQYSKIESIKCLSNVYSDISFIKDIFEERKEDNYFENYSSKNSNNKNRSADIIKTFNDNSEFNFISIVNEELIKHGDEEAVQWRIEVIKNRAFAHIIRHSSGGGFISPYESELERPSFANSLISKEDLNYCNYFNDFLIFSFKIRRNKKYIAYSNYLQIIVHDFYLKIIGKIKFEAISKIKSLISQSSSSLTYSFKHHLKIIESQFIDIHSKPNNVDVCIKKYNNIKSREYIDIDSSYDLRYLIIDIIENDLRNFISNEGFYKYLNESNSSEDDENSEENKKNKLSLGERGIQDILKIKLESLLLNKGIRNTDIYKEVELFDRKRIDLLIKYGFIGPIMIELKLLHNSEITSMKERKEYKKKLVQYINGTNSEFGIYLIFKVKNTKSHNEGYFRDLINDHANIKNLTVKVIDCTVQ